MWCISNCGKIFNTKNCFLCLDIRMFKLLVLYVWLHLMMKGRVDKHKCIAVTYKLMHIKFGFSNVIVLVYWHNINMIKLVKWGWLTLISDRNTHDSQTTINLFFWVFFYKICFNIQISHGCSLIRAKLYH